MKTKLALLCLLMVAVFLSCKKSDETVDFPPEIDLVLNSLTQSFDSLNTELAAAATSIAPNVADTSSIRNHLAGIYERSSFITECSFITLSGILQMIEPPAYYQYQGEDISDQDHVVKAFETKLPVLSQSFSLVEGYQATVILHPIVSNNQILGAINAVFRPKEILGRAIIPVVEGETFEIWVMEKGGVVLFDQDEEEIGLNVITDPLYADFPELIAAAQLIDSEESGKTTYSFYQTGTGNLVVKETYWKTLHICDNQWKIVWVIPIES